MPCNGFKADGVVMAVEEEVAEEESGW